MKIDFETKSKVESEETFKRKLEVKVTTLEDMVTGAVWGRDNIDLELETTTPVEAMVEVNTEVKEK